MTTLQLKVTYYVPNRRMFRKDESCPLSVVRRLDVGKDRRFDDVLRRLNAHFSDDMAPDTPTVLKWMDSEGDSITVSSETEWVLAVADHERELERLATKGDGSAATSSVPTLKLFLGERFNSSNGDKTQKRPETSAAPSNDSPLPADADSLTQAVASVRDLMRCAADAASYRAVAAVCAAHKQGSDTASTKLVNGTKRRGLAKLTAMATRQEVDFSHIGGGRKEALKVLKARGIDASDECVVSLVAASNALIKAVMPGGQVSRALTNASTVDGDKKPGAAGGTFKGHGPRGHHPHHRPGGRSHEHGPPHGHSPFPPPGPPHHGGLAHPPPPGPPFAFVGPPFGGPPPPPQGVFGGGGHYPPVPITWTEDTTVHARTFSSLQDSDDGDGVPPEPRAVDATTSEEDNDDGVLVGGGEKLSVG